MKSFRGNEKVAIGERASSRHRPEAETIGYVGPLATRDERKRGPEMDFGV